MTDAVGGVVRVRALVTAVDAGTLFDLRCLVREHLVSWVQRQDADGLPAHARGAGRGGRAQPAAPTRAAEHSGVFSGDARAERRGAAFRRTTREDDPTTEETTP